MTKPELEQCIDEYGKDIYSFCRYLTCNVQEADDLYQDTFLKAVEMSDKIEYQYNPKSYLLSIALRIWKNRRRKYAWRMKIANTQLDKKEQGVKISEEVAELSPEEWIMSREEVRLVRESVDRLPKRLKIIVILFYMEELSVIQIASVMKIPAGTVKSRLYQARKLLEKELEGVLDEKRNR